MKHEDEFYIGYLPKAPEAHARFVRCGVVGLVVAGLLAAAGLGTVLPYIGDGRFEFGSVRDFDGTLRCDGFHSTRLVAEGTDYLLVGPGKHRAPPEMCGADGAQVRLSGTLIAREGRQLIEVVSGLRVGEVSVPAAEDVVLGRFTLSGEIVDSKCYFGVMNPGEGRAHRACAMLCLRGGVPPVFVARDRSGASAHLLIGAANGLDILPALLPWVGEHVEASGEVVRRGRWLLWRIDPASLRRAAG